MIEKPPNDGRFIRGYGSVHGLWALVSIMPNYAQWKPLGKTKASVSAVTGRLKRR